MENSLKVKLVESQTKSKKKVERLEGALEKQKTDIDSVIAFNESLNEDKKEL